MVHFNASGCGKARETTLEPKEKAVGLNPVTVYWKLFKNEFSEIVWGPKVITGILVSYCVYDRYRDLDRVFIHMIQSHIYVANVTGWA